MLWPGQGHCMLVNGARLKRTSAVPFPQPSTARSNRFC
jgi:hypothetical protein